MILWRVGCSFLLAAFMLPQLTEAQMPLKPEILHKHRVQSKYQEKSTAIFYLSTKLDRSDTLHIVFILPVEAESTVYRYGNGIREVKNLLDAGLIRDNVLFVQPGFSRTPWYGNHPENLNVRQEDYLLEIMMEVKAAYRDYLIETYLLGFSKSGWGSMSLLFSHPELIDGGLIWDAPLSAGTGLRWGMEEVFVDEQYFADHYWLPGRLSEAERVLQDKHIVVGGYDNFRTESVGFVDTLRSIGISVVHLDHLSFPHTWDVNWVLPLLREAQLTTR